MRRGSPAITTSRHLLHWLLKLRWSYHANLDVLGPAFFTDSPYLLLLYGIGPNLSLAVDDYHVTVPSF